MDQHRLHLHGEQHDRRVVVHHGFSPCRQVLGSCGGDHLPGWRHRLADFFNRTRSEHRWFGDETLDLHAASRCDGWCRACDATGGARARHQRSSRRIIDRRHLCHGLCGHARRTATVNAVAGVATFTNLTFAGTASTNYTLSFAPPSGLTTAVSNTFTVSVGTATQLVLTTSASGATYGNAFTTQPWWRSVTQVATRSPPPPAR